MAAATKKPLLSDGVILNDKWEILEHIATGGRGEVYRARQTNLDREVVVKTISPEFLAELDGDEEEIETELQRFHREAMAMARIRHPYIVQIYDQDSAVVPTNEGEQSVQYVVMEYVPGPTLRSTMPQEGFGSRDREAQEWVRNYFLPVLEGVEAIHNLGIVHRDIKPENVLLEGVTPKITDFGIAGGVQWQQLTRSHHVEGTIQYMAEEQFMDLGETDVRGDIYALGKILYEAVCGKMDKQTARPFKCVLLDNPDTPFLKRLDSLIRAATAEDKERRTSSVKELRESLEKLLEDFDTSKFHVMGVALPRPNRSQKIIGIIAIVLVIALIVISNLVHHVIMVREEQQGGARVAGATSEMTTRTREVPESVQGQTPRPHPAVIGKDGSALRYVPGGEFSLPDLSGSTSGTSIRVAPFYMGETEITHAQYVSFLNKVSSRVSVENGAVKSNGHTWLMLGPVFGGYEPLAYENGRFLVKEPRYASYPVVKVTPYGASAYARFYDGHLPTEFQWYAAADVGEATSGRLLKHGSKASQQQTDLEQEVEGLVDVYGVLDTVGDHGSTRGLGGSRIPHSVFRYPRNEYGIRGLRANVGEWGLPSPGRSTKQSGGPGYVILGGLDGTWLLGPTLIRGPERSPSDASVSVGFRVVHKADARPGGEEQANGPQK
ncbi:MAG: bifunctional serine/threonine-protein kinase/formylglycine-generating enzyme family protein [Deltaproteobacteria bacterium]